MVKYLSLVLQIKDENDYLDEWLNWHRKIGVDHFYIFDHESKTPIERRDTDVIVWRTEFLQAETYTKAITQFGDVTYWMGFIDTDEFIVPPTNDLKSFLQEYEPYSGLAINSLTFGSSGHETRPPNQTDHYVWRLPNGAIVNDHVKSIIKPQEVIWCRSPHFMKCENKVVNENFETVDSFMSPNTVSKVRINHYFTRSREEWAEKIKRGRADDKRFTRDWCEFESINKNSIVFDDRVVRRFV